MCLVKRWVGIVSTLKNKYNRNIFGMMLEKPSLKSSWELLRHPSKETLVMQKTIDQNISVITPVYNAEGFISKAVASALSQPEVGEVILIEDGSTDTSLTVCRQLAAQYEKVKLFTHPGNTNKGAGLSRNLGIQNAVCDYVAFLDADDFFLPDRFKAEREMFAGQPEIDGVYGALGFHYYSKEGEHRFREKGLHGLTTLPGKVDPRELFLSLLWLHDRVNGYFSLDTLTVKRNIFFEKTPLFNELKLHEDSVFILQLSLNCVLEPGIIDAPVAMRGVHDDNRISINSEQSKSRLKMWEYLYDWSVKNKSRLPVKQLFKAFFISEKIRFSKWPAAFYLFVKYSVTNRLFFTRTIFFNPSCMRVFGKYAGARYY